MSQHIVQAVRGKAAFARWLGGLCIKLGDARSGHLISNFNMSFVWPSWGSAFPVRSSEMVE